jgi:peptide chain release factor 1
MIYDKKLYDALDIIEKKYQELLKKSEELDLPFSQLKEIKKQIKTSQLISEKFNIYKNVIQNTNDAEKLIETEKKNSDMYELAQLELQDGKEKIEKLEIELKILLIPVDPNDEKNITIEMRPAAGGDEASIFVSDLFETYKAFASLQG